MAPAVGDGLPQRGAGPRIGLGALFFGFLKVSLCGFGGPVLWARRILVDRQRWFDDREFAELLSFCQFLPGPNIVSLAVCAGTRFRGAAGALAALAGYIVVPWSLGFALAALYLSYAQIGAMQGILRGISAAAAGLIIGTGLRLLLSYRARPTAVLFAALAFAGAGLAKLPLLVVVVALVPLSIALAGRDAAVAA